MNIFHTNENYIVCHGFDHSFAGTQKDALYAYTYTHYSLEESFLFIHFFRSLKLWLIQWRIDIFRDWIEIIQISFFFTSKQIKKENWLISSDWCGVLSVNAFTFSLLSSFGHRLYLRLFRESQSHALLSLSQFVEPNEKGACGTPIARPLWSLLMFDGMSQKHVKIKHSLWIWYNITHI